MLLLQYQMSQFCEFGVNCNSTKFYKMYSFITTYSINLTFKYALSKKSTATTQ